MSRELQELLVGVFLKHDVLFDHSVLDGKFQGAKQAVRHWCRVPQEFPWPDEFSESQSPLKLILSKGSVTAV